MKTYHLFTGMRRANRYGPPIQSRTFFVRCRKLIETLSFAILEPHIRLHSSDDTYSATRPTKRTLVHQHGWTKSGTQAFATIANTYFGRCPNFEICGWPSVHPPGALHSMDDRWVELDRLARLRVDMLDETGAFLDAKPYLSAAYEDRSPLMHEVRAHGIDL